MLSYLQCFVVPCYRYKICRAENPAALHRDFKLDRSTNTFTLRSFDCTQNDALAKMRLFLRNANDVNHHFTDMEGATKLWDAARFGCHLAVEEALQHPSVDPNKAHKRTGTTPLYIAAYFGHERVVKALLSQPSVDVNCGKGETTPLFVAVQEGREGVVKMLLDCKNVDAKKASAEGITPSRVASEFGHEHISDLLSGQFNDEFGYERMQNESQGLLRSNKHMKMNQKTITESVVATAL
jgi:ankyrin repeat protein